MFRLALKSVRHSPKRLILTAVAVALGVSLVAATHIFTNSLSSGFNSLFSEIYKTVDVVVEVDPDSDITVDPGAYPLSDADLEAVRSVDGVMLAEGGVGGDHDGGTLLPADGVIPDTPGGGVGGPPSLFFNWVGNSDFDRATVVDGRGPESAGEIVLDVDTVADGYEIGQTVSVATLTGVNKYTLVGSVTFGEDNATQGATLGWLTADDARALAGVDSGYNAIGASIDEGADKQAVAAAVNDVLADGTRALTGDQKAAEEATALDDILQYVDIFTIAFALISLFVGAYIIVNTFRIIVTQRTREFGLLRAVGVTGKQIRSMILLEAIVVGLIASTLGILLGYLLALGITSLLSVVIGDIFGTLTLPVDSLLWGYGLGMLVTVAAAILPAIHASRISPMEALRESATESKKPLRLRNIVGSAMTLSGALSVSIGLYADFEQPYIWVGVGAVLLVLGVTLLAAQLLVPLAFALRGMLTALFRVDGKLAANNIRREPRRSANTAAALMIGVMLLALVATFTESLKAVVTAQFSQTNADFLVLPTGGEIPPGALAVISDTDGVDFASSLGVASAEFDGADYQIAAIEPLTADAAFDYNNDPDFTELDGGVFIDPTIQALGIGVGDDVTLTGAAGTETLPVTGLYLIEGDSPFFMDFQTAAALSGEVPVFQAMVVLDDGADADAIKEVLDEALAEDYPLVSLEEPGDLEQLANQFIDILLGIISALLGSALVIAILGVANTLLLSVTERTREIGLLRAVGLRRRSVWRMITLESMVMAIFGAILGMILGTALGSALVLSLEDFGFDGVTIPWVWLAIYTVLAAIAGVVAAIWPAWRASRLDILKAIATE